MQKHAFPYVFGVVALSFLCSCGAGKKEEIKVDVKGAEATKEVAFAEQQPQAEDQAVATTENKDENTTMAQATTESEEPVDSSEKAQAAEENKIV